MIEKAKETWRRFKHSEPGRRFQDHHRYQQGRIASSSYLRWFFGTIGGLLVVVGGIIAVPGPGPGWLIILLGLWMLTGELLFFARFMDRVEVRLSKLVRCVIDIWTISSALVKGLIILMILVCVAVLGYGTIIWFV